MGNLWNQLFHLVLLSFNNPISDSETKIYAMLCHVFCWCAILFHSVLQVFIGSSSFQVGCLRYTYDKHFQEILIYIVIGICIILLMISVAIACFCYQWRHKKYVVSRQRKISREGAPLKPIVRGRDGQLLRSDDYLEAQQPITDAPGYVAITS